MRIPITISIRHKVKVGHNAEKLNLQVRLYRIIADNYVLDISVARLHYHTQLSCSMLHSTDRWQSKFIPQIVLLIRTLGNFRLEK